MSSTLRVASALEAVPQARAHLRRVASGVLDDAALVLSELVTNAVLHGAPPIEVVVEAGHDSVRLAVRDGSRVLPVRPLATADAMTGRGIGLVQALSQDWGVERSTDGKRVWAVVCTTPEVAEQAVAPYAPDEVDALLASWDDVHDEAVRFTVSLGDVPTDLLLGAKAHLDNVVREYTLAAGGTLSAGREPAVPADVARTLDTVVHRFAAARRAVKRQALAAAARGEARTRLTVSLSLAEVEAGEDYLAALDLADRYARAARLLTLQSPRRHRVFRRWYVEALVTQVRSRAAGKVPEPPPTFEERLAEELDAIEDADPDAPR